ncbi:MAG: hypothetical protein IPF99_22030 [Deltaproteobacteria bacterium]|nr:hypothetical protein [Deltaproteobacteria bacterium]
MCGRACATGARCTLGRCVGGVIPGASFQVALSANNCSTVDHLAVTGDDRGGIAVSGARLFYSGDTSTGRFDLQSLVGEAVGRTYDGLVSNLATGALYTLAIGSTPVTDMGGTITSSWSSTPRRAGSPPGSSTLSQPTSPARHRERRHLLRATSASSSWAAAGRGTSACPAAPSSTSASSRCHPAPGARELGDLGRGGVPTAARSTSTTCRARRRSPHARARRDRHPPRHLHGPVGHVLVHGLAPLAPVVLPPRGLVAVSRRGLRDRGLLRRDHHGPDAALPPHRHDLLRGVHQPPDQRGPLRHVRARLPRWRDLQRRRVRPRVPGGQAACTGACVDLNSDPAHCGACGRTCIGGQWCIAGACGGGPNYAVDSSLTAAAVPYVDACGAPGAVRMLPSTDDAGFSAPIPFATRWWGAALAAGAPMHVVSNGYVQVNAGAGVVSLGHPAQRGPPTGSSRRNGATSRPERRGSASPPSGPRRAAVVAQWFRGPVLRRLLSVLNFEVIVHEGSGVIDLAYGAMSGAGTATVGLENPGGTQAVGPCPSNNSCTIISNARARFTPIP